MNNTLPDLLDTIERSRRRAILDFVNQADDDVRFGRSSLSALGEPNLLVSRDDRLRVIRMASRAAEQQIERLESVERHTVGDDITSMCRSKLAELRQNKAAFDAALSEHNKAAWAIPSVG